MKKIPILLMLLSFCFTPIKANLHKYYISITEIHHNQENGRLELSIKVFYDDLVKAMEEEEGYQLNDPIEIHHEALSMFITKNVQLTIENENVPLSFVGSENQLDAVWFYLESEQNYTSFNQLTVQNTIFVNLYALQSNIINFFPQKGTSKGVKGLLLNRRKPKDVIYLNNEK